MNQNDMLPRIGGRFTTVLQDARHHIVSLETLLVRCAMTFSLVSAMKHSKTWRVCYRAKLGVFVTERNLACLLRHIQVTNEY